MAADQHEREDRPNRFRHWLDDLQNLPLPLRWAVLGASCAGVIGAIVGLVVGLIVYAPTAWFALFELGFPAMILGGIVGLVAGAIVLAASRIHPSGN